MAFFSRLTWCNLPVALLIALLQRSPLLRTATAALDRFASAPLGAMLRAATVGMGSLGTVHALAGATTLVTNKPSPLSATVGQALTPVAFGINGPGVGQPGSWVVGGAVPPGLNFSGLTAPGTINIANLVLSGTPTTAGTYAVTLQGWENKNKGGKGSPVYAYNIEVSAGGGATTVAPGFTAQPSGQTVTAGASISLTVTATGTPAPTLQWWKDGAPLAGATGATYAVASARPADAGTYSVVATNSAGSLTSAAAQVVVNAATVNAAPSFATQPANQTAMLGGRVSLVVAVSGTPAPTLQWLKDGTPIAGATASTYVIAAAGAGDAGVYTVVARNAAGSATSTAAQLSVMNPAGPGGATGRLVNLSILTNAGAGASVLTMGAVVGGAGAQGALPLVIRAVGPTLGTAFGITGVLSDPVMTVNAQGAAAPIAVNDNWGGTAASRAAFAAVGAFALPDSSLDCAYVPPSPGLAPGGYTVQVAGTGNGSGLVIAEIYDASGSARTAGMPRLINLSTLAQIDAGGTLAVGFVIGGTAPCTVLVRAVGPTLGTAFGIGGVMADPGLVLFSNDTGQQISANDDWGGGAALSGSMSAVGAFALADPASRDAVLVATLPPGAYSARVSGKNGTGGTAIVEVYEVP